MVKRDVHVFQEKGDHAKVVEELSNFVVLNDLNPSLLLFAIGGLGLVLVTGKTVAFGVDAAIGKRFTALRTLSMNINS